MKESEEGEAVKNKHPFKEDYKRHIQSDENVNRTLCGRRLSDVWLYALRRSGATCRRCVAALEVTKDKTTAMVAKEVLSLYEH